MEGYNTKRLATVLSDRMKVTSSAAVPKTVELGTYNADQSITPDSLRVRVPKGEYMINFMLAGDIYTSSETVSLSGGAHGGHESGSGHHSHTNDGNHNHRLPPNFFPLQAGDRILIVWCGTEPIVVAKVVSS